MYSDKKTSSFLCYLPVGRAIAKVLLLLLFIALLTYCNDPRPRELTRAFYYWKSGIRISAAEVHMLEQLKAKKIYIKYFDIVKSRESKTPVPVAKIPLSDRLPDYFNAAAMEIIPVIFITNECFRVDSSTIPDLAKKSISLLRSMMKDLMPKKATLNEIQFDCDWTAGTKNNYFYFLSEVRKILAADSFQISATIRLYQCKYLKKTGVPPVDRGLLMCYNMGNLRDPSATGNSILDVAELKKYTEALAAYPLQIDVALPLFDWKVLIRNDRYAGLFQQLPDSVIQSTLLASVSGNSYTMLVDTLLYGYSLKKGDILRNEQSKTADIIGAGNEISRKLSSRNITVSLYHLDPAILSKYPINELENIYNSLR